MTKTPNFGQFPGDTYGDPDEADQLPNPVPDEDGEVRLTKRKAAPRKRKAIKAKARKRRTARRRRGSR